MTDKNGEQSEERRPADRDQTQRHNPVTLSAHCNDERGGALDTCESKEIAGNRSTNKRPGAQSRNVRQDRAPAGSVEVRSRNVPADASVSRPDSTASNSARPLRNSSNSARVKPIRLLNPHAPGNDPKAALSLDAQHVQLDKKDGDVLMRVVAEAEAEESSAAIDWGAALKSARLTKLERRAIEHSKKGVPLYRLHQVLGCKPNVAKKALECTIRKISREKERIEREHLSFPPVPHSRRLVQRERLQSAPGRPYAFLPPVLMRRFNEIMQAEKYNALRSQRDPRSFQKTQLTLWSCIRKDFKMLTKEDVIQSERAAAAALREWHSAEYCEDLANSRAEARIKADRQTADRERISELKQPQLQAEHTELIVRYEKLRVEHTELAATVKKVQSDPSPWRNEDLRKLHEERDRVGSEIDDVADRRRYFQEEIAARNIAALRSEVESILAGKETRHAVTTALKGLEPVVAKLEAVYAPHSQVRQEEILLAAPLFAAIRSLRHFQMNPDANSPRENA